MARRRPNNIQGIVALAFIGGILWILSNVATGISKIDNRTFVTVASFAGAFLLLFAVSALIKKWLAARDARRVQESLARKVYVATQEHLSALARKRMQQVQFDAYGNRKDEKWKEELKYFLFEHLGPSLTDEEQFALYSSFEALALTIDHTVERAICNDPSFLAFSNNMSPTEFENFCAEELRQVGWNTRVTKQSRDQGIDVIAEKSGVRVVLQCKLYTSPVGNKAVQAAAAGRAHERANYGAVVTNNRFTAAAEQLAATNGILLLHYRDLRSIDVMLPPILKDAKAIIPIKFDQAKWVAMVRRDPQLGLIADKLRPLGQKWVDKFAESYLAINDKKYLPKVVSGIIAEARKEFEREQTANEQRTF